MILHRTARSALSRFASAVIFALCPWISACSSPLPEFPGQVVPRGHLNLVLSDQAEPRPVHFSDDRIGVCLEIPPGEDASQWRFEPTVAGEKVARDEVVKISQEAGFVCFEWGNQGLPASEELEICGRVIDGFDDRQWRAPCWQVAYRPGDDTYDRLEEEWYELLDRSAEMTNEQLLAGLAAFRSKAEKQGLVSLAVQSELVAAHFLGLEGTAEAITEARARLERLPAWLDAPEASYFGGLTAYQRARLELSVGNLSQAWRYLEIARERFRRIAEPTRLSAESQEARILAALGSPREAARLLRLSLELEPEDVAAQLDARGQLDLEVTDAANQLAWVTLLDPEASRQELQVAKQLLAWALGDEQRNPLERANFWINSSYVEVRLGESPTGLDDARQLLQGVELGSERSALLRSWIRLIEGLDRLRLEEPAEALEKCEPLAGDLDDHVAGWALSCMAQAREQQGDLARAEALYEQSILRQRFGQQEDLGRGLELGPSQPAVNTARAARVAIERSNAAAAWQRLLGLDQASRQEGDRKQCRDAAKPGTPEFARWQELDAESSSILERLNRNARRASWQGDAAAADRELQERLQTLWREWPGCESRAPRSDQGVEYRAFWVDGEVFLLHRGGAATETGRETEGATGRATAREVRLVRRTSVSAEELSSIEELLDQALDPRNPVTDAQWNLRLSGIAQALRPETSGREDPLRGDPGALLVYALHGRLQRIPLAGLEAPRGGYLADHFTLALHLAGGKGTRGRGTAEQGAEGNGTDGQASSTTRAPLFVVDPERNLRGSTSQEKLYGELFPRATILAGDTATRASVQRALSGASWFHVDAHAEHDDAFPELSYLGLADGPLHWLELAETELDLEFANLSSCESGRWPTTADSGSFGLAGLIARLGAGWVVASRGKLDNEVAIDFNRAFYAAVADGDSISRAYRKGLVQLRNTRPVAQWSSLLLLRSPEGPAVSKSIANAGVSETKR